MAPSLADAKQRIKREFLGKSGIHAVGIRPSDDAVAVYVDDAADADLDRLRAELERTVAPVRVVVVSSKRASTRS